MERARPSWTGLLAGTAASLTGAALLVVGTFLSRSEWRFGRLLVAAGIALVTVWGLILRRFTAKSARLHRLTLIFAIVGVLLAVISLVLALVVSPPRVGP